MGKVLLVGVLVLAFAGEAQAQTVIAPDNGTSRPYQQWADQSKVPTPAGTVRVVESPPPSCVSLALGCADRSGEWLYVAPSAPRSTFLHELGHIFDAKHLDDAARAWFAHRVASKEEAESEWVGDVEETFAKVYAVCARRGPQPHFNQLSLTGRHTKKRHLRGCRLIKRVGRAAGLSASR